MLHSFTPIEVKQLLEATDDRILHAVATEHYGFDEADYPRAAAEQRPGYSLHDVVVDYLRYLVRSPADFQVMKDTIAAVIVQKTADDLAALAEAKGVDAAELDDLVHDVKGQEAAAINNDGLDSQIAYLIGALGVEAVKEHLNTMGTTDADPAQPEE
jgi:hypothetical protein